MAERTHLSLADDNPLLTKTAPELREILSAHGVGWMDTHTREQLIEKCIFNDIRVEREAGGSTIPKTTEKHIEEIGALKGSVGNVDKEAKKHEPSKNLPGGRPDGWTAQHLKMPEPEGDPLFVEKHHGRKTK